MHLSRIAWSLLIEPPLPMRKASTVISIASDITAESRR